MGPHRPWLFVAHGWDWRWLPWGEGEARVAAAAAELKVRVEELTDPACGAPRPATLRLAYPSEARPAAVLLDLAIQALGAVPVPVARQAEGVAPEPAEGVDGWLEPPAVLDLERRPPRETVWPEGLPVVPAPGVAVRDPDGSMREVSSRELSAAARELGERIRGREGDPSEDRRAGGTRPRDIVVSARSLDDPEERLLLAWALRSGAAVVLEPRREDHVATARWVRPTVFAGDVGEVEALARAAESYRSPPLRRLGRRLRKWWGSKLREPRPLDRLRTVLLRSSEADRRLPEALRRDWERRGVDILRI